MSDSCEWQECDCDECCGQSFRGWQGAVGFAANRSDAQGFQGYVGPKFEGPRGDIGAQGGLCACDGIQGLTGCVGPQGDVLAGRQGSMGFQGQTIQGPEGIQGLPGPEGPIGATIFGPQGNQGVASQGFEGVQGEMGQATDGSQGPQGYQGLRTLYGTGNSFDFNVDVFQIPWSVANTGNIYFINVNVSLKSTIVQNYEVQIRKLFPPNDLIAKRSVSFNMYNYETYQIINFDFFGDEYLQFSVVDPPNTITIGAKNASFQRIGGPNVNPLY